MRWILLAGLLAGPGVVLTPALEAQGATPAATKPMAANPQFAGVWEGNYTTDGPSGIMTLELTSGASWKVSVSLGAEGPAPGEPTGLVVDGNKATWKQPFGEYDVTFVATLNTEGTQIAGTLEATQGGSFVGGGSYTLNRKPK